MRYLLQQLITGISIGGIYSLLAVGYALIYSVFDFSNFAFGCVMMISAFTAYYCITLFKMPIIIAFVIAIIFGIAVSLIIEIVAYRPLRKRKTSRLFLMITGMGIDLAVVTAATLILSGNYRAFPSIGIYMQTPIEFFGGITIGKLDIFASIFSIAALIILWLFLNKTKSGLAIRASAYDTSIAGMMGINVNKISIILFAISGITAAIAGIFFGMKYAVYPTLGSVSMKAFIASVFGGLGSLPGAVLGGMMLGILETLVSGYISSMYRDLFSFGLLIIVLLFMPNGILGKSAQEKI